MNKPEPRVAEEASKVVGRQHGARAGHAHLRIKHCPLLRKPPTPPDENMFQKIIPSQNKRSIRCTRAKVYHQGKEDEEELEKLLGFSDAWGCSNQTATLDPAPRLRPNCSHMTRVLI